MSMISLAERAGWFIADTNHVPLIGAYVSGNHEEGGLYVKKGDIALKIVADKEKSYLGMYSQSGLGLLLQHNNDHTGGGGLFLFQRTNETASLQNTNSGGKLLINDPEGRTRVSLGSERLITNGKSKNSTTSSIHLFNERGDLEFRAP